MTDKLEIPDTSTLEGESLNYWCGIAYDHNILKGSDGSIWLAKKLVTRWNPIEDAVQCLELTPRCDIYYREFDGPPHYIADITTEESAIGEGPTELIARCRAYLASKRENNG